MTVPLLLHRGDAQHGVDRYARDLAAAVARLDPTVELRMPGDVPAGSRVHLHFTDRLWGSTPADAATVVEGIAAHARVTVTLHDVPQPSDGAGLDRRAAAYRRVVDAATAVVCSSEHERSLLRAHVGADVAAHVVPLPCEPPAPASPPAHPRREIGVLGYFYPGKGHSEAVEASAALPSPLPVVAIGRAASGHEGELAELVAHAAASGVAVTSTGFLSDDALRERARATAVPVVAHRHVSASGSLTTWLAAGRRPIVVRGPYFAEMDALRPGTMTLVDEDGLAAAIERAVADPASTWLDAGVDVRPTLDDVARAHLALWEHP
ncbi:MULTISPECIES: hypothetical protein [unclassified Agrococcus]|uniref:hypothetical protein n=1 Tax=unclassified Agrococcus TaxID=2615065 RepID=UPI00361E87F3